MRIFVTGATGVVGRRVIPLLVGRGHEVTAVARSAEKAARLERAGARPAKVDLFDRDAMTRAVAGHEAVVNLATHIPRTSTAMMLPWKWRENDRIRRDGSAILVDAALAGGARRLVQESLALAYPDRGDAWIDERTPLAPVRYNRTTLDAEASAGRFAGPGREAVILRFAGFYGADSPQSVEMLEMVRKGWFPVFGRPDAYFSSVALDDAATAVLAALEVPGGVYDVVEDEPLTRAELAWAMAGALGVRVPRLLPAWIAPLGGSLGRMIARSLRVSNRKLKEASGWAPAHPSAREGWAAVVRELGTTD